MGPPTDGGWGWVVVVASLVASMLSDGLIYSYGILAPEFVKHYGISRSSVGWMGSLLVAVSMIIGPLVSYLCNRFSYRAVATTGAIISVVSVAAPYFYHELWFLILSSSVLCGIGFGMIYLPSIIIVNVWFDKKRPLALGIAVSGSGFGAFVFSPLLQHLITKFGWQTTMLITACIFLLNIPCCLAYTVPKPKEEKDENNNDVPEDEAKGTGAEVIVMEEIVSEKKVDVAIEMETEEESSDESTQEKMSTLTLMKNAIFILFVVSNIMTNIGFNAPYMFAKDRAIEAGISKTKASFIISSLGIGNCVGRMAFGLISTIKCINRFHVFNGALIFSGLILILSWVITNYSLMILYTSIFGVASGAFVTLTSIILGDIFGMENLDAAFGICLSFHGGAVLFGPPFIGWVYDLSLSFNLAFAVCGMFISASGVIMYLAYISKDFRKKKFHS